MEELSLRMMHLSLMKGIAPAYFDAALAWFSEQGLSSVSKR